MKLWIYHKTEEPIIINDDEADSYYKKGWKDSPASFIKTTEFNVDPDDNVAVQQLGEAFEGVKDMANGALNLSSMSAKELDKYAKDNFNKKLKAKTKPSKIKEIEGLING